MTPLTSWREADERPLRDDGRGLSSRGVVLCPRFRPTGSPLPARGCQLGSWRAGKRSDERLERLASEKSSLADGRALETPRIRAQTHVVETT